MITLIDTALLDAVAGEAAAAPRRRRNRNFHPDNEFPAHRLLNAVEPDSYIPPHRHLDPAKDETMVVLRGSLGLVEFDEQGTILRQVRLDAGGPTLGCDILHGTYHSVLALVPGTIFFEAKAGPFVPLSEAEKAPWAPAEGDPAAPAYLRSLAARFAPPA